MCRDDRYRVLVIEGLVKANTSRTRRMRVGAERRGEESHGGGINEATAPLLT